MDRVPTPPSPTGSHTSPLPDLVESTRVSPDTEGSFLGHKLTKGSDDELEPVVNTKESKRRRRRRRKPLEPKPSVSTVPGGDSDQPRALVKVNKKPSVDLDIASQSQFPPLTLSHSQTGVSPEQAPKQYKASEVMKVVTRGSKDQFLKMQAEVAEQACSGIAMLIELSAMVALAEEVGTELREKGMANPLGGDQELTAKVALLVKSYEHYLKTHPDESIVFSIFRDHVEKGQLAKHQIIRLTICNAAAKCVPNHNEFKAGVLASFDSFTAAAISPLVTHYIVPYVKLIVGLELLRQSVIKTDVGKDSIEASCVQHLKLAASELNGMAVILAEVIFRKETLVSGVAQDILKKICISALGIVEDCISPCWVGEKSETAYAFWEKRFKYIGRTERVFEAPVVFAGLDLNHEFLTVKEACGLLEYVCLLTEAMERDLSSESSSYAKKKHVAEGLEAIRHSLDKGWLKKVMSAKDVSDEGGQLFQARVEVIKRSMESLDQYRAGVKRQFEKEEKERLELVTALKEMVAREKNRKKTSGTSECDTPGSKDVDQSSDHKQETDEEEGVAKASPAPVESAFDKTMKEAAVLLQGKHQNPSRAEMLFQDAGKEPGISAHQRTEVCLGTCEAILAQANELLSEVIEQRRVLRNYAELLQGQYTVPKDEDKAFLEVLTNFPESAQALIKVFQKAEVVLGTLEIPEFEGDLKVSCQMVIERMRDLSTLCNELSSEKQSLSELYRLRGEYIHRHFSGGSSCKDTPRLHSSDIEYAGGIDEELDEEVMKVQTSLKKLQEAFLASEASQD